MGLNCGGVQFVARESSDDAEYLIRMELLNKNFPTDNQSF